MNARIAGWGAWLLFAACLVVSVDARANDKIVVAVGGRTFLGYLPLTLAGQLGYYKDAGLEVQIVDFEGGAKAMEAVVGGSADVALGGLEQAVRLQVKGIDVKGVVLINTSFGQVIALKPSLAKTYKSPKDLQGKKFGVIGPGSASAIALNILMAKAGLPSNSVAQIGIGGGPGAIAAVSSGQLDGVSNSDPVISQILHDGDMIALIDTRTEKGQNELYGGPVAATSVMMPASFIDNHRAVAKAFVQAIVKSLAWMSKATPTQVADKMPPTYYGDHRDLYIEGLTALKDTYTSDGIFRDTEISKAFELLTQYGGLKSPANFDIHGAIDNSLASGG